MLVLFTLVRQYQPMVLLLATVACAFGVACLMTYVLVRSSRLRILDHPNERSLHNTPVPRTGGLAIWAGGLVGIVVALVSLGGRPEFIYIAAAALLVGVVSFIDDHRHVPVGVRLIAHLIAGGLLLIGGLMMEVVRLPGIDLHLPSAIGLLLSVLFIVWMINLYNFMDGMDGLAGGMAVIGFGALGLLAYGGNTSFAALCWAVAAAAGGFLFGNFPPARIFMGDTGASVLGLMAAALSLWGDKAGLFPLWVAVLVFSPFVVDATVTLFRRAWQGERIWEAHCSHYYQYLVQLGWGHRKTVLIEYGLMILCAASAVLHVQLSVSAQWITIAVWTIVYVGSILAIEQTDRRLLLRHKSRR